MAEITLSRAEQETTINLTADQDYAEIYTADPVWMRKMEKLREQRPDVFELIECDEISRTYKCPKKCVRVSAPRIVTDEQREAARERFARAREKSTP